jgi:Na+/pantothenate symporter
MKIVTVGPVRLGLGLVVLGLVLVLVLVLVLMVLDPRFSITKKGKRKRKSR